MKKIFAPLFFAAIAAISFAVAQPGPGPQPNPWVKSGNNISYSLGGILAPSSVTGGSKGVGTVNATGLYVGGNAALYNGGPLGAPSSGNGANITNVNAATLGGATFAAPGSIGYGTPGAIAATMLSASGAASFTSTVKFTGAMGAAVSNGDAYIGADTTYGLRQTGKGSAYDYTLFNGAGSAVIAVPTGTTRVEFQGAINYGSVTLSNSVTGTGSMVLSASPTLTGTLGAAGITASGIVTLTSTNGEPLRLNGATTGPNLISLTNTGGQAYFGQENSAGNNIIIGSTAYDTIIRGPSGIAFSANAGATLHMRLTNAGSLSVSGGITASNGVVNLGSGSASIQRSGNYVIAYSSNAVPLFQGGNASDPTNYYSNTTHAFRNAAASATYATIGSGAISTGAASTTQGSLVLHNTTANSTTLKSSNSASAAYTLTLPPAPPAVDDYVLSAKTTGVAAWVAAGGSVTQTTGTCGTLPTYDSTGGAVTSTYSTQTCTYVKTGKVVTVTGNLFVSSSSGGSGSFQIANGISDTPTSDQGSCAIGQIINGGFSSNYRYVTMYIIAGTKTLALHGNDFNGGTYGRISIGNMQGVGFGVSYSCTYQIP